MVIPLAADESGAESAGRVHGSTGERPAEQDVESNSQADSQPANFRRTNVDSRAVNNKSQEKGKHSLYANALNRGCALTNSRCAFCDQCSAGNCVALEQNGNHPGRHNCASKLRTPISDRTLEIDFRTNKKGEGHCGIQVAAGNAARSGNHNSNSKTVSKGYGEQSSVASEVSVIGDNTDADKNQREGPDKFSDALFQETLVHQRFSRLNGARLVWADGAAGAGASLGYFI